MDEYQAIHKEEMEKFNRSIEHDDFDLAIEQFSNAQEALFISDEIHNEMMKENRSIER